MLDKSKKRRDEFYKWIGLCIKEWASIEDKLFELCMFALKAPEKQTAIVYYRTPTIDSRLKLTDELLRTVLPQREKKDGGHDHPDVTRWVDVMNAINDLLPTRNLLAHSPVRESVFMWVRMTKEQPPIVERDDSWLEVAVSANEEMRGRKHSAPIKSEALPAHFREIEAALNTLIAFSDYIRKVPPAAPAPRISPQG